MRIHHITLIVFLFLSSCFQKKSTNEKALTLTGGLGLMDTLIDCNNIQSILQEVEQRDQENRLFGYESIDQKIDHKNLRIVISIIENCKPKRGVFNREEIEAIWLVIQHSDTKYAIEYFDLLVDHTNLGLLNRISLLMMLDRILLSRGVPQEYGTQVCKDLNSEKWNLCEPFNLDSIRIRRAESGFGPIEDYVQHWGIVFYD